MVNRNAARHLLLAVSILLCFFVYMGYRYFGSEKSEPVATQYHPFEPEVDSVTPIAPGSAVTPPTDVSVPIDNDDASWVSSMPSAPASDSGFSAPSSVPSSVSAMPAPPSASSAGSSGSSSGAITGLIPAPAVTASSSVTAPSSVTEPESVVLSGLPISSPGDSSTERVEPETPASISGLRPPGLGGGLVESGGSPSDTAVSAPLATGRLPIPGVGDSSGASRPETASSLANDAPIAAVPTTATVSAPIVPPPSRTRPSQLDDDAEWSRPEAVPASTSTPAPPVSRTAPEPPATKADGSSPYGPYRELPESLRIYVVLPGDTLSSIAARELGSASLAENIFLLNRDAIEDPDHLPAGVRIRLPVRSTDIDPAVMPDTPDVPGRRPAMGLGRTHIVVRGDTLSSIAQQYYGPRADWRFLYEANKAALPNPNQLSVGMELSVPPYEP